MKVLVIAAHPDDEVLGCGATIAKHVKQGDIVDVLILGDGITARYEESELNNPEVIEKVKAINGHAFNASKVLGVNQLEIKGFHCTRFDKFPLRDFVGIVEKKIKEFKPDRVYTHGPNDVNIDHGIVYKAVQTATRPMTPSFVKEVFLMEILSGTEWNFLESFRPDHYIDVVDTIQLKVDALREYSSEKREFPHPRSDEGIIILAKKKGSEVGLKYAEAFKTFRVIK
ncbi:MAG: PIG-L deacetylase family protein [Nanoarchaeota archaeon]